MKTALLFCLAIGMIATPLSPLMAQGEGSPAPATPSNLERLLAARPRIDRSLTMEEAVTIALQESPVLRGASAEVRAAEGRLEAARAQRRPYLSANTFLSGGSNPNIVSSPGTVPPGMIQALPKDAFADQNLSAMYPLYTSGRLEALVQQASALRAASGADREAQRQEIILMTQATYRDVIAQRAMVTASQARLAENKERLRLDQLRLQQEQIPAYFISRDEAEVADAEQEAANAGRDADVALLRLKVTMGINPASRIEVVVPARDDTPSVEEVVSLITGSPAESEEAQLGALLRRAGHSRPELAAASQRLTGAERGLAVVRGNYGPQVSLFSMGDVSKASGQKTFGGLTFGLTASVPLYSGGQREADKKTAEAERARLQEEERGVVLQVAQEVESSLLDLRVARKNVDTARVALVAAQEGYRVAKIRYEAGRSIITEVLDAQAAQARASGKVVQAIFRFGTAQDQLQRAVGYGAQPSTPLGGN